jgi:hypothetical protein
MPLVVLSVLGVVTAMMCLAGWAMPFASSATRIVFMIRGSRWSSHSVVDIIPHIPEDERRSKYDSNASAVYR